MSDKLVPIALSSEIDVTGVERVHAAPYTPAVRPSFVAPPPPEYFVWQSSDTNAVGSRVLRTGYGSFDTVTNTITYLDYVDKAVMYPATGSAGVNVGGDLIFPVYYDNVGTNSGVYAYKWDGTNLVEQAHWYQDTGIMYQEYFSLVKWDEQTVICTVNHSTPASIWLYALTYDGTDFTEAASLDTGLFNSDQILAKHGNYLIMLQTEGGGNKLRAYTFNGTAFTLVATYTGTVSTRFGAGPKTMHSDGLYIFVGNGQVFSFDGSTFTLITQEYETGTTPFNSKLGNTDTAWFSVVAPVLRAYQWTGTDLIRAADPVVGNIDASGWMKVDNGRLWIASNPEHFYINGVFDIDGTTLTKLADLRPPSPSTNTIFYSTNVIPALTVN